MMTTFFNWRVLTYYLPFDCPIHLQRSVAVDSQQLIYALAWSSMRLGVKSSRSPQISTSETGSNCGASLPSRLRKEFDLETTTQAAQLGGAQLGVSAGPILRIHRIPFRAFLTSEGGGGDESREAKEPPHAEYKILEYQCDSVVPGLDRQIMIQAATVEKKTDRGKEIIIVVLDGYRAYMFNTGTREWLAPIEISSECLLIRQFISMRGPYLFVHYHSRIGGAQFAIIDVAEKSVRIPVRIPSLPKSHGLTFFVAESSNTLNVIVDRWPRCSREWWSLDLDSLLSPTHQQKAVVECTQKISSESIELHHSDFIPIGNRWIVGVNGTRWKYHDYEENSIPHQINYVDGQKPGTSPTLTVIDKCNGRVQKVTAMTNYGSEDEALPPATCSPGFYIPFRTTNSAVTLELPAMLLQSTGKLVLRLWGSSLTRLPNDINQIREFLSNQKIDSALVIRILSFMLT